MDKLIEWLQKTTGDAQKVLTIFVGLIAAIFVLIAVIKCINNIRAKKWTDALMDLLVIAAIVIIAWMGAKGLTAFVLKVVKPSEDILPQGAIHSKIVVATAKSLLPHIV